MNRHRCLYQHRGDVLVSGIWDLRAGRGGVGDVSVGRLGEFVVVHCRGFLTVLRADDRQDFSAGQFPAGIDGEQRIDAQQIGFEDSLHTVTRIKVVDELRRIGQRAARKNRIRVRQQGA